MEVDDTAFKSADQIHRAQAAEEDISTQGDESQAQDREEGEIPDFFIEESSSPLGGSELIADNTDLLFTDGKRGPILRPRAGLCSSISSFISFPGFPVTTSSARCWAAETVFHENRVAA